MMESEGLVQRAIVDEDREHGEDVEHVELSKHNMLASTLER